MTAENPEEAPCPELCLCDEGSFWPWLSWPSFQSFPGKLETVVVIPVAGFADWGLGHPLDCEETLLMSLIRDSVRLAPEGARPLVVPPLRFVLGPDTGCAFAVDQPSAHSAIAEIVSSVAAAGFVRLAIVNASPWNEELIGAAARDLRLSRGLHLFVVHLSALGLDLHPSRSRSRRALQTLLTSLYRAGPQEPRRDEPTPAPWGTEPVPPLPGSPAALSEALIEGPRVLSEAAARLAGLLSEIRSRPLVPVNVRPL